jgi:glutathione S-transferase
MPSSPELVLCDFELAPTTPGWESFSPFVLEVDRALKLAKLPYTRRHVSVFELRKMNPLGQLPVLFIGSEAVNDSTRILHRIDALAPGSMTGGLDARGVAETWLWEEFADTALYPFVLATRWADDRGWPVPKAAFFSTVPLPIRGLVASMVRRGTISKLKERDFTRGGLDACYERMGRTLDALDARAPENGFWLGDRPTAGDLGLFGHLHSLRISLVAFAAEEVAKRSRLSRYLDRVDDATRG